MLESTDVLVGFGVLYYWLLWYSSTATLELCRLLTWFYPLNTAGFLLLGQISTGLEVAELYVLVVVQLLREIREISKNFSVILPVISFKMYRWRRWQFLHF